MLFLGPNDFANPLALSSPPLQHPPAVNPPSDLGGINDNQVVPQPVARAAADNAAGHNPSQQPHPPPAHLPVAYGRNAERVPPHNEPQQFQPPPADVAFANNINDEGAQPGPTQSGRFQEQAAMLSVADARRAAMSTVRHVSCVSIRFAKLRSSLVDICA